MNHTEGNRNNRRDAKRGKRYKPVKTGLPQGFTKAEWHARRNGKQSPNGGCLPF